MTTDNIEPVFSKPAIPQFIQPIPEEVEDRFAAPQQEGFIPPPEAKEGSLEEVSDLVEVTDEDIMGSDGDNPKQELDEEDFDDLFGVSEADLMGEPQQPRRLKPRPRFRRTGRQYPPPTSLIGLR